MKKQIGVVIKIIAIAVLLIGIAFLVKDSSHYLKDGVYSASAPTQVKFDALKRWIPQDAELVLVVDPHRLFASDAGTEQIAQWLEKGGSFAGLSSQLIAHLVTHPGAVGLVAAGVELSPSAQPAEGLLVVQGALNTQAMTDEITRAMAAAGVTLSKGDCGGIPLYVESSAPDAFALAFPDKHHMVLGTMKALEGIMRCDEGAHGTMPQELGWYPGDESKAVFGRIMITPYLKSILPENLRGVASIRLVMGPDFVLHAEVPCTSIEQAHQAQLFFEGARASLVMASVDKPGLTGFLLDTRMVVTPNSLRIAVPLKTVKSEM